MSMPVGQTQSYGHFNYNFDYDQQGNNTAQTVNVDINADATYGDYHGVVGNLKVNSQDHTAILTDKAGHKETFQLDKDGKLTSSGNFEVINNIDGTQSVKLDKNDIKFSAQFVNGNDQQLKVDIENHGEYLSPGDTSGRDVFYGKPTKATEKFSITAFMAAEPGKTDGDKNSGVINVDYTQVQGLNPGTHVSDTADAAPAPKTSWERSNFNPSNWF